VLCEKLESVTLPFPSQRFTGKSLLLMQKPNRCLKASLRAVEAVLAVCVFEQNPVPVTETSVLRRGTLLKSVIHIRYVPGLARRFQDYLTCIEIAADKGVHGPCCLSLTVPVSRGICFFQSLALMPAGAASCSAGQILV